MFIGLILIVIGALFLFRNLGLITGNVLEIFWPVILIIIGLAFFKKKRGYHFCCGHHDHDKEEEHQQK